MCGIAGILHFDGPGPRTDDIERITHALRHRGPDDEGYYRRDRIAFGHGRLSIIDRENGRQPMTSATGHVAITYNGEIYNFRELRAELQSLGFLFATQSDTEVLLHAWEAWQDRAVLKLRGMFAFAI